MNIKQNSVVRTVDFIGLNKGSYVETEVRRLDHSATTRSNI